MKLDKRIEYIQARQTLHLTTKEIDLITNALVDSMVKNKNNISVVKQISKLLKIIQGE